MMRIGMIAGLLAATLMVGPAWAQTATPTTSDQATSTPPTTNLHFDNLRNTRYCEIFTYGAQTLLYNTTGVDTCPTAQWSTLTPDSIAAQAPGGASSAYMNGQRFWLMDQIQIQNTMGVTNFGGIQIRLWATTPATAAPSGSSSAIPEYTETIVERDSQWYFDAGKPVFELITNDSP